MSGRDYWRQKRPELQFDDCETCANRYSAFCGRCTIGQFYREEVREMNIDEFGFDKGRRDD